MKNLPYAPEGYDTRDQQEVRTTIERAIADLERPLPKYTSPSVAATSTTLPVRDLPAAATLTDVRDVLITLLADLRAAGRIG